MAKSKDSLALRLRVDTYHMIYKETFYEVEVKNERVKIWRTNSSEPIYEVILLTELWAAFNKLKGECKDG